MVVWFHHWIILLMASTATQAIEFVSGYTGYAEAECVDPWGGVNIRELTAATATDCAAECDSESTCVAIYYSTTGECWLKSDCELNTDPFIITGILLYMRDNIPAAASADVTSTMTPVQAGTSAAFYNYCMRRTEENAYWVSQPVTEHQTPSAIQCAQLCVAESACEHLMYRPGSGDCHVARGVNSTAMLPAQSNTSGWNVYVRC